MKVIEFPGDDDEVVDFLNSTFREVIMLLDLKHKYVIQFIDAFLKKKNEICIITELAERGSLYDYHKE